MDINLACFRQVIVSKKIIQSNISGVFMFIANRDVARFAFLFVLAGSSAPSFASDGILRFFGAITEPVCTVQGTSSEANAKSVRLQAPSRSIDLAVRCNTAQAVHISFEEPLAIIEARALGNSNDAEMVLTGTSKTIRSGDSMRYVFPAQRHISIPLTASMQQASGADSLEMRKHIMLSFDYQ
ncbi:hypothetical protein [Herbaspirillum rhizosphaerae]|uniref:hypothetical protein n=1 Tax=Herbaspirillum rhizosphaerae TaxID=346179 RepID=UPI00067CDF2D|nr:hypothetical protein [Herbaspirillum rhizosphaerae]